MKNQLYKYFTQERLGFISDKLVRFTQPSAFNDPFEFLPYEQFVPDIEDDSLEVVFGKKFEDQILQLQNEDQEGRIKSKVERVLTHRCPNIQEQNDIFENQKERLLKIKKEFAAELQNFMIGTYDNLGVFCLSEEWNNILMWSHYANNHQGFVIGFNVEHPFFLDYEFELKPVSYSSERPTSSIRDNYIQHLIYTKADIWCYEKEWRICKEISKADKVINGNIYLYEIPVEAIEVIYLGARINDDNKSQIIEKVSQWECVPEIYQVNMHSRKYELTSVLSLL